ncbi:MAG: glycosyltransferase family 39 protein [Armatimonadetes bacterium]|nr:glycosyltransferase family 39 protein [Armatimonadota bacterium]
MARTEKGAVRLPRPLVAILALSLLLRLGFAAASLLAAADPAILALPDTRSYLGATRALIGQGIFTESYWLLFRPPLYPAFLAPGVLLGAPGVVTACLQAALGTWTVWGVWRLARLATGSDRAALASALLYAVEPLAVVYAGLMMSETLFAALVVLALLLYARFGAEGRLVHAAWAATAMGCAALCRPIAVALPLAPVVVLLAAAAVRRSQAARLLIAAGISVALGLGLPGLWQLRNLHVHGWPVLSSGHVQNNYYYNAASVIGAETGRTMAQVQAEMVRTDFGPEHPERRGWSQVERVRFMDREGMRIVRRRPDIAARLWLIGIPKVLLGRNATLFVQPFVGLPHQALRRMAEMGDVPPEMAAVNDMRATRLAGAALLLVTLLYYTAAALGLRRLRPGRYPALLLAGVFVYLLALSGGAGSEGRFRHPLMPILCVVAGAAFVLRPSAGTS